jgi:hypothetical protein
VRDLPNRRMAVLALAPVLTTASLILRGRRAVAAPNILRADTSTARARFGGLPPDSAGSRELMSTVDGLVQAPCPGGRGGGGLGPRCVRQVHGRLITQDQLLQTGLGPRITRQIPLPPRMATEPGMGYRYQP